jgi:hypothetical protein
MDSIVDNLPHESFRPQATTIRRAERTIHANTETEATDHERNELARKANDRFLRSGAQIRDGYAWD